jgi:phospholipid transport system substrate-binding protein
VNLTLQRRSFGRFMLAGILLPAAGAASAQPASAAEDNPGEFIRRLSDDVLETLRTDKSIKAGGLSKVIALVDAKILPHVDFKRMTASAVGPSWRQATPEQQQRLQEEFKILLVRTYAGALEQFSDQKVAVQPFRGSPPQDQQVLVRTEIRGSGDPVQLDYRLEKTPGEGDGWKIYNINVLGVWLVDTYRSQFSQEINNKGIDGLIAALVARNKGHAKT